MKKLFFLSLILFSFGVSIGQTWTVLGQPNAYPGRFFTDTINNIMYAGGSFDASGPFFANRIAAWNGTSWDSVGSAMDGTIMKMINYNGDLYAGGSMATCGTTTINYITRWDGITWQPMGSGVNSAVFDMAVYNGELYVCGTFTVADGDSTITYIARWNGTTWTGVGGGTDNGITSLCVYNNKLIAGGNFTHAGGVSCNRIAQWDGTTWSPLAGGAPALVGSLAVYKNNLYVGMASGGQSVNHILKWNGTQFSTVGAGLNGYANELNIYSDELYVIGTFTSSGTLQLDGIARWNGYAWISVGTCPGLKYHMGSYSGDLYVSGFALLQSAAGYFAKWNSPTPIPPVANFTVSDSTIQTNTYIKFQNTTAGSSVTCQWFFPGGNPSSSVFPDVYVTYPSTGIYDVTLIASSSMGTDTLTKTQYIHVDNVNHPIDTGISTDYVPFIYDRDYRNFSSTIEFDTCTNGLMEVDYYKPSTYDSINSPIVIGVHGLGGNGMNCVAELHDIAERRKALVVSPTMQGDWAYDFISAHTGNTSNSYSYYSYYQSVFKQIYRYVMARENRAAVPVYLIGFSAGGQLVTRMMLIRQGFPDSIPIRMAVSVSPFAYTFCTDTLKGIPMYYPCGLLPGYSSFIETNLLGCNEHVIQYYNENYGVLIGTGDVASGYYIWSCDSVQGDARYDRAQNFYAFSDSDATARGTTLQWQYREVPGVGHDIHGMFNTKASPTDTSTIAETLLFDTPYHTVPSITPLANFVPDTTIVNVNTILHFTNTSVNTSTYLWKFGDGSSATTTNPNHIYSNPGTYGVRLTATSSSGCSNRIIKHCYIDVVTPTFFTEYNADGLDIKVFPNPASDKFNINLNNLSDKFQVTLCDIVGRELERVSFIQSTQLNTGDLSGGIYLFKIYKENKIVAVGKLIKE